MQQSDVFLWFYFVVTSYDSLLETFHTIQTYYVIREQALIMFRNIQLKYSFAIDFLLCCRIKSLKQLGWDWKGCGFVRAELLIESLKTFQQSKVMQAVSTHVRVWIELWIENKQTFNVKVKREIVFFYLFSIFFVIFWNNFCFVFIWRKSFPLFR